MSEPYGANQYISLEVLPSKTDLSSSQHLISQSMRACHTLSTQLSGIRPYILQSTKSAVATRHLHSSKMMSLWTPRHPPGFSSLFRMLDDFERYAQQTVGRPTSVIPGIGSPMTDSIAIAPKFDVTEHEKSYSLQGELPGVSPEHVSIEFTDPQTMVISGHAEREHTEGDPSLARIGQGEETKKIESGKSSKSSKESKESKEEPKESSESTEKSTPKYWLSERSFGEFSRVFNFPAGVDQDKVEAKFNNGILNITVPKVDKKGGRKIEIK